MSRQIAVAVCICLWFVVPRAVGQSATGAPGADSVAAHVKQLVDQIDQGSFYHWHRTDAIVKFGREAIAPLVAILEDAQATRDARTIAAEALGRLGDASALDSLRRVADGATDDTVRDAAAVAAYVLGDHSFLDRDAETMASHADSPFGTLAAKQHAAKVKYQLGQFAEAAALYKELADAAPDPKRRAWWNGSLACNAALAGDIDTALNALAAALGDDPDLSYWPEHDGDFDSIKSDPRWATILADAKSRQTEPDSPPSPDPGQNDTPETAALRKEYEQFINSQRDAESKHCNANPSVCEYVRWLKSRLRGDSAAARDEFIASTGHSFDDPVPALVAQQQSWVDRLANTPVRSEAESDLLETYLRYFRMDDFIQGYTAMAEREPDWIVLRRWAGAALFFAKSTGNRAPVHALVLKLHDTARERATIARFAEALGSDAVSLNDREGALKWYGEAAELFGDTYSGRDARREYERAQRLWPGTPAPDFHATDIRGNAVSLSDYKGKVVLLDFWATDCGPCVFEMPNLIQLRKDYRSRGFEIIGISFDQDPAALQRFLDRKNIDWPQICDLKAWDGELSKLYVAGGIPDPILIDRRGNIGPRGLRGEVLKEALLQLLDQE